jgi:Yip1 domain
MLTFLRGLVGLSFREPRQAARAVLSLPLGDNGRWAAFALMAVVSAALMHVLSTLAPLEGDAGEVIAPPGPFFWVFVVGGGMLVLTGATYGVGRLFGGKARPGDLAVLVAWLQALQLVIAVAQVATMVLLPILGGLIEIASLLAFLWLLSAFVTEAHGFRSMAAVAGGVVVTFFVLALVFALLLYPYFPTGV